MADPPDGAGDSSGPLRMGQRTVRSAALRGHRRPATINSSRVWLRNQAANRPLMTSAHSRPRRVASARMASFRRGGGVATVAST
jgi:hypothetical protein